jgi:hypothetical protein
VPTASAGAAPSAANPLAASTARIALRISNLLILIPRLAGSTFIDTSRTSALQSSHSALQHRRQAEYEFFAAGSSAKFRKMPAAQH